MENAASTHDTGAAAAAAANAADGSPNQKNQKKKGKKPKGSDSPGATPGTPAAAERGAENDTGVTEASSSPAPCIPQSSGSGSVQQGNQPASSKKQKGDKKKGQAQGQGQDQGQSQGQSQGKGQGEGEATQGPQKSKAELKAERRAMQEAQRAAKAAKKEAVASGTAAQDKGKGEPPRVPAKVLGDDPSTQKKEDKKLAKQHVPQRASSSKKVAFFSHLRQYDPELRFISELPVYSYPEAGQVQGIHPKVKTVGLKYADYSLVGSSCRAASLLGALQAVVQDYKTPADKDLCRDLDAHIKRPIAFITQCRPISISQGNAIKFLKKKISQVPPSMSEAEAKKSLNEAIDRFVQEKILKAGEAIAMFANQHIIQGEYIIVYGYSFVVLSVLVKSKLRHSLTVIVVDNRPRHEGRAMLRRLKAAGIKCVFVAFNNAPMYIRMLTQPYGQHRRNVKLVLGAHGVLSNGFVQSRMGSAMLASTCQNLGIPVLVCHETYKISERSQTDSFVFNELGDPNEVIRLGEREGVLGDWMDKRSLTVLNLMYDLTANCDVDMFVTEVGVMSDTSIHKVLNSRAMYETS